MTTWNLDKTKANKVGQSDFIIGNTQTVLKIISAAWLTKNNKNGGQNYALSLYVANDSKSTAHLDIYYGNSNGERWSGENLIHAIMTCCNVPTLSQVQGTHYEYHFETKSDVAIQATVAPELSGKFLGVFLSENWYVSTQDNQPKKGTSLFNVYDFQTNQLAWQKNQGEPANPAELEKVFEATKKASDVSKSKAYKQVGISLDSQAQSHFNQDEQNFTYRKNPSPQQGFNNQMGNSMPMAGQVNDDDVPF